MAASSGLCCLPGQGASSMISYLSASGSEAIVLSDRVLAHLRRHRQLRSGMTEAGGLLFARFLPGKILVEQATGPGVFDRRSRVGFIPSVPAAQRTIRRLHGRGLHYVGDWHTHPETIPTPSAEDCKSIRSVYQESIHHLAGLLMVIAGTSESPSGLFVAIADTTGIHVLTPKPPLADESSARARRQHIFL